MTICPRCGSPAILETFPSTGKPYLFISRTICESGHCEVDFNVVLDREKSRSRCTMSRKYDRRPVIQTLNGQPLIPGYAD